MKIFCESCRAQYSVAGEQVAGRTVKNVCKRCGNAMLVRGPAVELGSAAPRNGAWYVMVDDQPRGPFDAGRIATLMEKGMIDWNARVWTEGLERWCAIRELLKTGGPMAASFASGDEPPTMRRPRSGPSIARDAPRAAPRGAKNDVAPPRWRAESSALFSLSSLQALSRTRAGTASAAPEREPARTRADGSGSVELGALAAGGAGGASVSGLTRVDELLAFGAPNLGRTMLGPPLITPPETDDTKPAGSRLAVTAVVCMAAVAILAALPQSQKDALWRQSSALVDELTYALRGAPTEVRGANESPPTFEPERVGEIAPPEVSRQPDGEMSRPDPFATPSVALTSAPTLPVASSSAVAAMDGESARDAELPRRHHRERRHGAREEETHPAAQIAEPSEAPSSGEAERDVDALLDHAVSGRPARDAQVVADDAPQVPSRSDIVGAMEGVSDPVRACGRGARATVPVRILFAGQTGRVRSAQVQQTSVGPEVRSCIARAVRRAEVPRFGQETFSVTYPFRL